MTLKGRIKETLSGSRGSDRATLRGLANALIDLTNLTLNVNHNAARAAAAVDELAEMRVQTDALERQLTGMKAQMAAEREVTLASNDSLRRQLQVIAGQLMSAGDGDGGAFVERTGASVP